MNFSAKFQNGAATVLCTNCAFHQRYKNPNELISSAHRCEKLWTDSSRSYLVPLVFSREQANIYKKRIGHYRTISPYLKLFAKTISANSTLIPAANQEVLISLRYINFQVKRVRKTTLLTLNTKNASGFEGIPTVLLKKCAPVFYTSN